MGYYPYYFPGFGPTQSPPPQVSHAHPFAPHTTQQSPTADQPAQQPVPRMSGGERLDLHVSEALRAKILAGKAIDMADIFAQDPRRG